MEGIQKTNFEAINLFNVRIWLRRLHAHGFYFSFLCCSIQVALDAAKELNVTKSKLNMDSLISRQETSLEMRLLQGRIEANNSIPLWKRET